MTRPFPCALALAVIALCSACADDEPTSSTFLRVDSSMVASATVVPNIDPARTYEYDFSAVRPDSVLLALWNAGLPLSEAWLPVDYLCEDVRGPRLTVELTGPDPRIEGHDFHLGTGRLQCSEQLWRYEVTPPDPQRFTLDATVRFADIEGGCWMLAAGQTARYEPVGLPSEFMVDGLRVRATLSLRPDMLSICMIAPSAEVLSITRR